MSADPLFFKISLSEQKFLVSCMCKPFYFYAKPITVPNILKTDI